MKKIFLTLFITSTIFACKKDDTNTTNPSIVGKWNIDKIVQWETPLAGGLTVKDTISYLGNGSYINFSANSKAYDKNVDPATSIVRYDTTNYFVNGNTFYSFHTTDTISATIQTLTNTNLLLYATIDIGIPTMHRERWVYFSK